MRAGGNNAAVAAAPAEIVATIEDQASTQVIKFTIPPSLSLITDQNTMSYMDASLSTDSTAGSTGLFGMLKRGLAGESVLSNIVTNKGTRPAELVLAPPMVGAIVELKINPGEKWKLYPGSFMAATPNIKVSGSINILKNLSSMFVSGSASYTTVEVNEGTAPGRVWIYGYGGISKKTVTTDPLIINNGVFLAIPSKLADGTAIWDKHVKVEPYGGLVTSFLTNIGFVMKIQPAPSHEIPVYMQTVNIENLKGIISTIARNEAHAAGNN